MSRAHYLPNVVVRQLFSNVFRTIGRDFGLVVDALQLVPTISLPEFPGKRPPAYLDQRVCKNAVDVEVSTLVQLCTQEYVGCSVRPADP